MKEIWFWSDLHLGHENCYTKFTNYDGTPMRPWNNMLEAEERMIENFNALVKPTDTVYNLGDIGTQTSRISYFMDRLVKCRHILLLGNHDNKIKPQFLLKYFNDIRGCYNLENYIMSHIPISYESRGRFKRNIHGHTHSNNILLNGVQHPWYKNVCVEVTNYRPINFSEIKEETERFIEQGLIKLPSREDRVI